MRTLTTLVTATLAISLLCSALLLGSDAGAAPGASPTAPVLAAPADDQPPPPTLPPAANPSAPATPPPARPAGAVEPGSAAPPPAADPGMSAAPATSAPPPIGAPPVGQPPVVSNVKKYATRGVFELGGGFSFSFHENKEASGTHNKDVYLGGEILMNFFVTRFFYLGPRISLGFNQYDTENDEDWSLSFGFSFAPGVAFPMGSSAFLFVETFGGFYYYYGKSSNTEIIRGAVGAEAGFKFLLGKSYLMHLSIRPIYYVGDFKTDGGGTGDVKDFYLLIRLGFSGFM